MRSHRSLASINASTTGVYCIRNTINGKRYVGGAYSTFAKRKKRHWDALRIGKHKNCHLQAAWNKYGEGAFVFEILEVCPPDDATIRAAEQNWIDWVWNHPDGKYNLSRTADGSETAVLEEVREKIVAASKRQWQDESHRVSVSAKISKTLTGRPLPESLKVKLSLIHSLPEQRAKSSRGARRQWAGMSDEEKKESLERMLDANRKVRGRDRYNAVLTEEIVREARALRAKGWTYKALQKHYGCGFITIYKAVVGITWSHVV